MDRRITDAKPCPFCGGAAEWAEGQKGDGAPWRYIACADCACVGPTRSEHATGQLIDWNTRISGS